MQIIKGVKEHPLLSGLLLLCLLVLCGAMTYTAPVFVTALVNGNALGWTDWLLGGVLPIACLAGFLALCFFKGQPRNKLRLAGRLAAVLGMALTFELVYALLAEVIPGAVYSLISGSILAAKIALGFALPLVKLPVYALLLCMAWSSLSREKLFCRYGGKRYLAILASCAVIHGAGLACSMLGALNLAQLLSCILTAILLAAVTSKVFITGGRQNEIMA